jgi:CBS domain-containing protein
MATSDDSYSTLIAVPVNPTAADLMTAGPRTCSPFSSVLEAVLIFRDVKCGAVPVVNAGQALGILTDRDVALSLSTYPDVVNRPVSDIMTEGVITVAPDTPIEEVRAKFGEHGIGRLLVCDSAGQVLGIIAWTDLASVPARTGGPGVASLAQHE